MYVTGNLAFVIFKYCKAIVGTETIGSFLSSDYSISNYV